MKLKELLSYGYVIPKRLITLGRSIVSNIKKVQSFCDFLFKYTIFTLLLMI